MDLSDYLPSPGGPEASVEAPEVPELGHEQAALMARQMRLQHAEEEARKEEAEESLRIKSLKDELLGEEQRQSFLRAVLERAEAGGAASRLARNVAQQRHEAAMRAHGQLLLGQPVLSSLLKEFEERQVEDVAQGSSGSPFNEEQGLQELRSQLEVIQLELAQEEARGEQLSLRTQTLEAERNWLQPTRS